MKHEKSGPGEARERKLLSQVSNILTGERGRSSPLIAQPTESQPRLADSKGKSVQVTKMCLCIQFSNPRNSKVPSFWSPCFFPIQSTILPNYGKTSLFSFFFFFLKKEAGNFDLWSKQEYRPDMMKRSSLSGKCNNLKELKSKTGK